MKKKTPQTDRRIIRTKNMLSEALIGLMLEKEYDAITIQDIIDKANVGRSTFYAHFESKEQLLTGGHEHFSKLLFNEKSDAKNTSGKIALNLLSLYEHAGENHRLAKAIFGKKAGDIIVQHLRDIIAHNIRKHYKAKAGKGRMEQHVFQFTVEAAAAAVVTFWVSWLENDIPVPAEEMARRSDEMVHALFRNWT